MSRTLLPTISAFFILPSAFFEGCQKALATIRLPALK
jgi:hypothetical protein